MTLPNNDTAWPPAGGKAASKLYTEWGAWYSGDPDELHQVYRITNGLGGVIDPKSNTATAGASGLSLSQQARFFWGNPPDTGEVRHTKLHIPLAADIASTSADLLYGEPPSISIIDEPATNAAIEDMLEGSLVTALLESGEIGSALGGAYIRVTWDPAMSDIPLYDVIPPDAAAPEWRSGRLSAVTFWRNLKEESGKVWRHLERHEKGRIFHGLYKGTNDNLGKLQDLTEMPETAVFSRLVGEDGSIETGSEELTAEYFPNVRPNRQLRGSPLGRSDYSGIESTFDALDETWSSLMRDIQLGKGRMVVPESYLETQGAGKGARFNAEKRYFTPVKALPGDDGIDLKSIQFDIRVDEHLSAARVLASQAIRGAGYSTQTFGDHESVGAAATATEIQAREKRSYTTRSRKIGYVKPPLRRLVKAGLEVYVAKFNPDGVKPQLPDVEFPDGVQTDELTVAKTVQMLDAAKAASTRTKVELVHPQWDEERIQEEVDAIEGAEAEPVEDPGDMPEGDLLTGESQQPPPAQQGPPQEV